MLLDKLFQSVEQSFEKAGEAVSEAAEEAFGKAQETLDKARDPLSPEEEKAIDEKMEQDFNEAETKGRDAMDELMDKLKVRFLNHLG
ncbi:MAG: hypothetical protein IJ611_08305 [Bacteroidales bacterium]|nr:hypothetical protein [Bacteroidales bacterium]